MCEQIEYPSLNISVSPPFSDQEGWSLPV